MTTRPPRIPRLTALALAVVVILAGLGGRALLPEAVGGPLGDVLFATLLVLLVALVRPRTTPVVAATVALVVATAIELSHLGDLPGQVLQHVPAARYVLGTTFVATDLAWYALGATVGGALLHVAAPRARAVDLDLRHANVGHRVRRRTATVVPVALLLVALAGATGAVVGSVQAEQSDLADQAAVARTALAASADRVDDDSVRTTLASSIESAQAALAGTPLLEVQPGDAAQARDRLAHDVAAVQASRLRFARAAADEAREALRPVADRAEVVLAASDDLADEGRAADGDAASGTRSALEAAAEALDATGDGTLADAGLEDVEAAVTSLEERLDVLERATGDLMTAQDAAACPEPDQLWFPEAGHLDDGELAAIPWAPGYAVRADVLDGLVALDDAYRAEFGEHLQINSAYRSYAQQVTVYNPADPNPLAAPPGCSNHGLGTAVDVSVGAAGFDSPRYVWLSEHAQEHGWTHPDWAEPDGRLPEPWHWQSVETPESY